MFWNQSSLTYIQRIRVFERRRILSKNSTSSEFSTKHEVVPCPCMIRSTVTIRVNCAAKLASDQHSDLVLNSLCFNLSPKASNCEEKRKEDVLKVRAHLTIQSCEDSSLHCIALHLPAWLSDGNLVSKLFAKSK